jgi:hypothetical protein
VTINIQVTKAIIDQSFWKNLAADRVVSLGGVSAEQLASRLKQAIAKKEAMLPKATRLSLVLALDATRLPGLGFDDVVSRFLNEHGRWAGDLGFHAVYLVGPNQRLTARLDRPGVRPPLFLA